jgi:hypothetical protein
MKLSRYHCSFGVVACALLALGCGNDAARSPTPTEYEWPERFAYRLDYVSLAQRDREPVLRYAETKTTRFELRDAQYFGSQDSVLKTAQRPGDPPQLVAYSAEDTLGFYVSLGRRGEIAKVQLGCDPAVTACAAALPSNVALELRRLIPRLPLWPAPRGSSWDDTLEFDETGRPGGTQSAMITRYTARADTVVSGRTYWVVGWHSARHAYRRGTTDLGAEAPVQEDGMTFVEKGRLLPVYATWAGAVAASPDLRALGASGVGYRGRAYLAGSVFDSLYAREVGP